MRLLSATLILLLLAPAGAIAYGLSPTFGDDGVVITDVGAPSSARRVAVQPDGEIVVAGQSGTDVVLIRYAADGTLDPAFGDGGIARVGGFHGPNAWRLTLQGDGKPLVAISTTEGGFAVLRVNADGSPDDAFGVHGVARWQPASGYGVSFALAIQPDGRIVVGGKWDDPYTRQLRTAVVRFLADGTLDTSFGQSGVVAVDLDASTDYAYEVAVLPDGKILASGDSANGDGRRSMTLLRFLADGTLDTTFGAGGSVVSRFGSDQSARGMAVQTDGKILLAGFADEKHLGAVVVRYLADGALDASFGDTGVARIPFAGFMTEATGLAFQGNGDLAVALLVDGAPEYAKGGVARLHPDGTLDRDYGICGVIPVELNTYGVAVEPNENVIAAGYYEDDIAVARFDFAPGAFCPAAPLDGCKPAVAAGSKLTVKRGGVATKDAILWQWRGVATAVGDFGDPASADYTMCAYDLSAATPQLTYAALVPAAGGWTAADDGFKYAVKSGSPCGVTALDLRAGADAQGRFKLQGKGIHVGAPSLPLALPLRVQLQAANGTCWDASFAAAGVQANGVSGFKARSE